MTACLSTSPYGDDPEAAKADGRGQMVNTAEERFTADTQQAATCEVDTGIAETCAEETGKGEESATPSRPRGSPGSGTSTGQSSTAQ